MTENAAKKTGTGSPPYEAPVFTAGTLVRPLTEDSGQFIPRTIREIVEAAWAAGAEVSLVESYP